MIRDWRFTYSEPPRPGIETPWRRIDFQTFEVDELADGLDCLDAVRLLGKFRETYETYFKSIHLHGVQELETLINGLKGGWP